jgi:hypothetical protein
MNTFKNTVCCCTGLLKKGTGSPVTTSAVRVMAQCKMGVNLWSAKKLKNKKNKRGPIILVALIAHYPSPTSSCSDILWIDPLVPELNAQCDMEETVI